MKTDQDVVAKDWSQLNDLVFANSWDNHLGRFRTPYAFRGLSNSNWDLATSLIRLGHHVRTGSLEPKILQSFKQYAYRDMNAGNSDWNWLAIAQHHGLPTRLLDWSFSPFVALHFATAELDFDKAATDGAIWCVNFVKIRDYLPIQVKNILQDDDATIFRIDTLSHLANSLSEFDNITNEPFPIFIFPPALDDRIVNQFAIFSTMSSPTYLLDDWLRHFPDCFFRIIIPHSLKWEIRDKLDLMNITERVLFPGLDGLSEWLKRYFSPRNPNGQ